jgi:hypothetical protein
MIAAVSALTSDITYIQYQYEPPPIAWFHSFIQLTSYPYFHPRINPLVALIEYILLVNHTLMPFEQEQLRPTRASSFPKRSFWLGIVRGRKSTPTSLLLTTNSLARQESSMAKEPS